MRCLSFIIILFAAVNLSAQSPHEKNLLYDCSYCHKATSWDVEPDSILFKHNESEFKLTGQHRLIDCVDCHKPVYTNSENNIGEIKSLIFIGEKSECISCHKDIHLNTLSPNCENCHTTRTWAVNNINELHQSTWFPLTGAHLTADCSQCHQQIKNLRFEILNTDCYSCHKNDYLSAKSPNHSAAGFSTECQDCHSVTDVQWSVQSMNHDFFPLTGGHNLPNCFSCHQQATFSGLSNDCVSCHLDDFNTATNPDHSSLALSHDCQTCHTTNPSWQPAAFPIHNNFYVLLGAHVSIQNDCVSCHKGDYSAAPTSCYGCHQQDYEMAVDPPHQGSGFSTDCVTCHTQNQWSPATFDHDGPFFPIFSGKHQGVWEKCFDCHTNSNNYNVFTCLSCHEHNTASMLEVHFGMNGYVYESNACYSCHPQGEAEGAFNHSETNFPLTGAHVSLNCSQCHEGGFNSASIECSACHQNDFVNTISPDHEAIGISVTCGDCHSTTAWIPSSFDHAETQFALIGAHQTVDCTSCHSGTTSGLNSNCISCHENDFASAPDHAAQNYPVNCEMCHNSVAWNQSEFNHQSTGFPLTGVHQQTSCGDCHSSGFAGTPSQCVSCHQQEYDTSTNPNHSALQLPSDCSTCHEVNENWEPAVFPVHDNYYQLLGAHAEIKDDCYSCHQGNYNSTPNTCYDCHQEDYNAALNPPHFSIFFPKQCELCHSQSAWTPAAYDHDAQYFPIYSGKHRNEWNNCSDCHTNPNNFSVFSCVDCHEHNRSEMDDEHKDVSGYVYNSQNCFSCHPDGRKKIMIKSMKVLE